MALGLEVGTGSGGDGYARVGTAEILHRHGHAAHGGVVDERKSAVETLEHHEVVVVPVDDGWREGGQVVDVGMPSVGIHAVGAGGENDVAGIAAIARHTAVGAQLLDGQPLAVICQQH